MPVRSVPSAAVAKFATSFRRGRSRRRCARSPMFSIVTARSDMSKIDPGSVRDAVTRTYASPLFTASTKLAGYTEAELAGVPEGVAFFGCGNPLAYAQVRPGQTVLDLGSGAGLDLILAARAVGPSGRAIGVDMTREMLERARANVACAGLANVELREGLIESLPVADASVDWVISNCVISLSPEKDRVFAE